MIAIPSQLASVAANVTDKFAKGGVADLRPVPRVLIDRGPNRSVYRMTGQQPPASGDPVLLVPPLAAPALCFDLRRGCSLAEHLTDAGRRTYLVDYGSVAFADRNLGIEHWIDDVLPRTIRKVSDDAGGRPVHVVAWCLGGIFSVLTAADRPELPIASLTTIASPFDYTAIPLVAPFRPLVEFTGGHILTPFYRMFGGAPSAVVTQVFRATGIDKEITKPLAILRNLDDRDYLAQIEAVDHFMANMLAYPGRTFGQIYHRFFRANDLSAGTFALDGRTISLSKLDVPTLVIAGENDSIAPRRAVERLVGLLENTPETRFRVAPGGHLGVLTGRRARSTTWRHVDEFVDEHASPR
ncbi:MULTISPECIES: alpha/beta fold hydrolase [Prauserella salsuginis group]|uniref:Polyhydroxyalkanoate synthase n=2 Tax=Prauserella salsuginis group TaxID=2893672 RepID=A0A839XL31_9PSEU|nr:MULTISPECIES: alpha/beta fold hydrolase [Prauserella salsuginis group]MBB3663960.1 polyhydroxyalkanoate synthase [Prauserella sediminis]MCR3721416.1 polyhydroxyalkanoate synthase [Prauserella flava]MCR3732406.1 polyhydroxyalkanoate synthase [Prauserella salsuginis]